MCAGHSIDRIEMIEFLTSVVHRHLTDCPELQKVLDLRDTVLTGRVKKAFPRVEFKRKQMRREHHRKVYPWKYNFLGVCMFNFNWQELLFFLLLARLFLTWLNNKSVRARLHVNGVFGHKRSGFRKRSPSWVPWVPEDFSRVWTENFVSSAADRHVLGRFRAGYFLRLDRNRKPRMKSLWHPGYEWNCLKIPAYCIRMDGRWLCHTQYRACPVSREL